ncbi:MAG: hypothetical protein V7736_16995 [Colwellia polaris]|nr:hypothetical protein [Colwellia polaris]
MHKTILISALIASTFSWAHTQHIHQPQLDFIPKLHSGVSS